MNKVALEEKRQHLQCQFEAAFGEWSKGGDVTKDLALMANHSILQTYYPFIVGFQSQIAALEDTTQDYSQHVICTDLNRYEAALNEFLRAIANPHVFQASLEATRQASHAVAAARSLEEQYVDLYVEFMSYVDGYRDYPEALRKKVNLDTVIIKGVDFVHEQTKIAKTTKIVSTLKGYCEQYRLGIKSIDDYLNQQYELKTALTQFNQRLDSVVTRTAIELGTELRVKPETVSAIYKEGKAYFIETQDVLNNGISTGKALSQLTALYEEKRAVLNSMAKRLEAEIAVVQGRAEAEKARILERIQSVIEAFKSLVEQFNQDQEGAGAGYAALASKGFCIEESAAVQSKEIEAAFENQRSEVLEAIFCSTDLQVIRRSILFYREKYAQLRQKMQAYTNLILAEREKLSLKIKTEINKIVVEIDRFNEEIERDVQDLSLTAIERSHYETVLSIGTIDKKRMDIDTLSVLNQIYLDALIARDHWRKAMDETSVVRRCMREIVQRHRNAQELIRNRFDKFLFITRTQAREGNVGKEEIRGLIYAIFQYEQTQGKTASSFVKYIQQNIHLLPIEIYDVIETCIGENAPSSLDAIVANLHFCKLLFLHDPCIHPSLLFERKSDFFDSQREAVAYSEAVGLWKQCSDSLEELDSKPTITLADLQNRSFCIALDLVKRFGLHAPIPVNKQFIESLQQGGATLLHQWEIQGTRRSAGGVKQMPDPFLTKADNLKSLLLYMSTLHTPLLIQGANALVSHAIGMHVRPVVAPALVFLGESLRYLKDVSHDESLPDLGFLFEPPNTARLNSNMCFLAVIMGDIVQQKRMFSTIHLEAVLKEETYSLYSKLYSNALLTTPPYNYLLRLLVQTNTECIDRDEIGPIAVDELLRPRTVPLIQDKKFQALAMAMHSIAVFTWEWEKQHPERSEVREKATIRFRQESMRILLEGVHHTADETIASLKEVAKQIFKCDRMARILKDTLTWLLGVVVVGVLYGCYRLAHGKTFFRVQEAQKTVFDATVKEISNQVRPVLIEGTLPVLQPSSNV